MKNYKLVQVILFAFLSFFASSASASVPGYSITGPSSQVAPNSTFMVTVTGSTDAGDWVGIFNPNDPIWPPVGGDMPGKNWVWLNGTYYPAPTPTQTTNPATVILTAPATAGTYELRVYTVVNGVDALAVKTNLIVGTVAPTPTPTPAPISSLNFPSNTNGLLRTHSINPIYFSDGSKAIYLGGHQGFIDLQDRVNQAPLDWNWYLQYLTSHKLNYIRNWTEFSLGPSPAGSLPLPYERVSGYGNAADGQLKVDLYRFNQAFFDRMRARAIELGNNGIYISYMLFDVYGFSNFSGENNANLFNSLNNINGINADTNGDGWGIEFFTGPSAELKTIQQNYVKKVVDTVGDLSNVFLEISNEAPDIAWHYDMINFIKNYQSSVSKRQPVFHSPGGLNGIQSWYTQSYNELAGGPSDTFSLAAGWGDYVNNPPPIDTSGKPAIFDMDHILGANPGNNDPKYPWMAFTRGYHFNLYDNTFEGTPMNSAWENVLNNIGAINNYANNRFSNLAAMNPSTSVCSTTFCLANPGLEYLTYAPNGGSFTVNLQSGNYSYEWFNISTASVAGTGTVSASGGNQSFTAPFSGSAVLYLKSGATPTPTPVSTKFMIGDSIRTTDNLKVRSAPGGSKILGNQKKNATGKVENGPVLAALNGTNYWWWYINYDKAPDGWSIENWLTKATVLGASTSREELIQSFQSQLIELQKRLDFLLNR